MHIDEPVYKRLFLLFRIVVGSAEVPPSLGWTVREWSDLLKEARRQEVVGVLFPAVKKMYSLREVPGLVMQAWETTTQRIVVASSAHRVASVLVQAFFRDNGFRSCVLKGDVSASYYPDPSLRKNGDIDVWVEGDRQKIYAFLKDKCQIRKTTYVHTEIVPKKGFEVEAHYTPSWMYSPFANRRMQRWFTSQAPVQFSNFDEALGLNVPTVRFNGTYMLLHVFRHLFFEGIGFRHVIDYYYVLRRMDSSDREEVRGNIRRFGLGRFASALMYVMGEVFLLEEEYYICKPDKKRGRLLLEALAVSGNFGKTDPGISGKKDDIAGHAWKKIRRNMKYMVFSPSEFFWLPFFMIWHRMWRRRNGYLYRGK